MTSIITYREINDFQKVQMFCNKKFYKRKLFKKNHIRIDFHTHTKASGTMTRKTGMFDDAINWFGVAESYTEPMDRFFKQRQLYSHVAITDHSYSPTSGGPFGAIMAARGILRVSKKTPLIKKELNRLLIGAEMKVCEKGGSGPGLDYLVFFYSNLHESITIKEAQSEFGRIMAEYKHILEIRESKGMSMVKFAEHMRNLEAKGIIGMFAPAHITEPIEGKVSGSTMIELAENNLIPVMEVNNSTISDFQNEYLHIFAEVYGINGIAGSDLHTYRRWGSISHVDFGEDIPDHYRDEDIYRLVKSDAPREIQYSYENRHANLIMDAYELTWKTYERKLKRYFNKWNAYPVKDKVLKGAEILIRTTPLPATVVVAPFVVIDNLKTDRKACKTMIAEILEEREEFLPYLKHARNYELREIGENYGYK